MSTYSSPPPLAVHARAGRLVPRHLGVRYDVADPDAQSQPAALTVAADGLTSGTRPVGPVAVTLECRRHGDATTIDWQLENRSDRPIRIDSAMLGARWIERPPGPVRFLRHGWQSWSFSGFRELSPDGEPGFPAGAWIRSMHHAVDERPSDRAGWHESATVTAAGVGAQGPACLCGALERGRGFAVVYLRRADDVRVFGAGAAGAGSRADVEIDLEVWLEITLQPGETRALESVRFALDDDDTRLLERFATLWGKTADARADAPLTTGWCSWYHYFHRVTEADILHNLELLAAARDRSDSPVSVDVVQLDDGYQRAIGDWLATSEAFPRGLAPLAADIRAAGFRAGLWTAPFCVVPESQIFAQHPEWLLQRRGGPFPALYHGDWSERGWVHALDPSRADVLAHLTEVFAALAAMGWDYLKLDFLHAVAMRADATDPAITRAQRLQRGLQAIRQGAGESAYLLGCGCPLGPAVGIVDAMRVGPDVAPHWDVRELHAPGLQHVVAATRNAVRGVVHRMWMHRRLWVNDPDCLLARSSDNDLSAAEQRTLATVIAATGGPIVFSDDVATLSADDRQRITDVTALARRLDSTGPRGSVRAAGWRAPLDTHDTVEALVAHRPRQSLVALINTTERTAQRRLGDHVSAGAARPQALLRSPPVVSDSRADGTHTVSLDARASAAYWCEDACDLAVFCDFDGTFITSDVWVEVMRKHVPEQLPSAWKRYRSGEHTIWEITCELAAALHLPESELALQLAEIALDPGARALVTWCRERGVPFRVLSDGFAPIIDMLLQRFGLAFPVEANRLDIRAGSWHLRPGAPDPACGCGTGTCKRGRLAAWRRDHPRAFCAFIGNGRISDLCGAMAADWVFAKDDLARALDRRGVAYHPYADLTAVVTALDSSWNSAAQSP